MVKQFLCIFFSVLFTAQLFSQVEFKFSYTQGDSYRILSTMTEDIFVNDELNHKAEIVNRISVKVTDVVDGWGVHEATFMTSEQSLLNQDKSTLEWGKEYKSVFKRSPFGNYDISSEYFMPVVRDVPLFPDRLLKTGDTWIADAHEAHDVGRLFNIKKPLIIPSKAIYTYKEKQTIGGKEFHLIIVEYVLKGENTLKPLNVNEDYPRHFTGKSKQLLLWDAEKGRVDSYNENFTITIITNQKQKLDFVGKAEAKILDSENYQTEENINDLKEKIENLNIENIEVTPTEKGLMLTIENIEFLGDSAVLLASEKEKVKKLAELLKNYPKNDLLITGHTAAIGNEANRKTLSLERAKTVGDYLHSLKILENQRIFTEGLGSDSPIADNKTAEGRSRNRRVEITILE
ncbi:MAG: OmpA family protein [Treponemataceae bacterium]